MTAPEVTEKANFNNSLAEQGYLKVLKSVNTNEPKNYWQWKKIVWFGTSIPCGTPDNNYPEIVADRLGAIVYNEAIGGSSVRCGIGNNATDDDPLGYRGRNFYNVALSLCGTIEEKRDIIDNLSKYSSIMVDVPSSLSDKEKERILSCSYENKLDKYLSGGEVGQVDLYVFDHGYNDNNSWNISSNDLLEMPNDKYDRRWFRSGMNFLINRFLEDNPHARICFIGHYQSDRIETSNTYKAQKLVQEQWGFPIFETWNHMGITENRIKTTGYWDNGIWIESGGNEQSLSMRELYFADGLHPYSDASGNATMKYAEVLTPFFINNVR